MRLILVFVTLLLCFTWMSLVQATHGPRSNCLCLGHSDTRVSLNRITNYTIQSEGICHITAVVFQTIHNKRVCSDPNTDWAKKAILKVDKEREALLAKEQNEKGSTTDITPAESTTPTNHQGGDGRGKSPEKRGRENAPEESQDQSKLTTVSSSFDITPAESTTPKKAPRKTGRKVKRRQLKKSRRWRKVMRKRT